MCVVICLACLFLFIDGLRLHVRMLGVVSCLHVYLLVSGMCCICVV